MAGHLATRVVDSQFANVEHLWVSRVQVVLRRLSPSALHCEGEILPTSAH